MCRVENIEASIALVYLARGFDDGLSSAEHFFEAYKNFPPGCKHELIVVAKGWSHEQSFKKLKYLAAAHDAKVVELPDDGYDWGAYMRIALDLPHVWVCFLNTNSRPRVKNWLELMYFSAQQINVGAVGATASWGTMLPIWGIHRLCLRRRFLMLPFVFVRDAFTYFKNYRRFSSMPNPHLRSNAFLIRVKLFREFIGNKKIPRNKREAHMLESGVDGFSRYLLRRGLLLHVVGANGVSYEADLWIESNTFRTPMQSNLLVSDNQTRFYDSANQKLRQVLEFSAWGKVLTL